MSFRIYGRQFAPTDYSTAFVDDAHWVFFEQAQEQCDWLNKTSDLYTHIVISDKLVADAWQETECWAGEHACTDEDMFAAKHMEFITTLNELNGIALIGS